MTNAEIIFGNRVFLMEQGVLKGVPNTSLLWKDEQGERQIEMPEEIHTFDGWKKLGFVVRKGEHATAKFPIWMPSKGKRKQKPQDDDGEQEQKMAARGFYMKMAFFFTADQVQPV